MGVLLHSPREIIFIAHSKWSPTRAVHESGHPAMSIPGDARWSAYRLILIGNNYLSHDLPSRRGVRERGQTGPRCNSIRSVRWRATAGRPLSLEERWILDKDVKNVLVTGGSKALGWRSAELFAAEGRTFAICARNAEEVGKSVKALAGKGGQVWRRGDRCRRSRRLKQWVENRWP